jgi:hypothetical protein
VGKQEDRLTKPFAQLLSFGCSGLDCATWDEEMKTYARESSARWWDDLWFPCGHVVDECPNCKRLTVECSLIPRINGMRCPICLHLWEGRQLGIRCGTECALCFLASLSPAEF